MEKIHEIIFLITALGGIHGIILSLVIRSIKKGNTEANKLFSLLLFLFSVGIADETYYATKAFLYFPFLLDVFKPIPFTFFPLFYLYIKALTTPEFQLKRSYLLHLTPAILFLFYNLPFILKSSEEKLNWMNSHSPGDSPEIHVVFAIIIIQAAVYICLSFQLLKRHGKTIRETFSDIQAINLSWLRLLLTGFLMALALIILLFIITISDPEFHKMMDGIIFFYVSIFLFWN